MKQNLVLFLLLFLPIISAVPILELQNEDIQPGETILAKITTPGEFTAEIERFQIKFFEGRKEKHLESDILFQNETHYLYIYTDKEQNLTLRIEDILFREGGVLQSATIGQNLTIKENELFDEDLNETYTEILRIKPGFIFTSSTPSLRLTNVGTSTLNFTFKDEDMSLIPMSSQELTFEPEEVFTLTQISTYKEFLIPTVYLKADENTSFISPTINPDLRASTDLIFLELFTENESTEILELFNFGDENLTNIRLEQNTSFLEISNIEDMSPRGTQNLTLEFSPEIPGHFQDKIKILYTIKEKEMALEIPLSIFVLPRGTPVEEFEEKEETCEELSGQVCGAGFLCNGTAIFAKNSEYCCLASCVEKNPKSEESSGFGWLIGIVILIVLAMIGYNFYKKQKNFKPETPKDSLQKSSQKFENRLAGNQNMRTTGNLAKT